MSSSRRAAVAVASALLAVPLAAAPAAAAPDHDQGTLAAVHSLRGPVTDESFYFVMADRFENGDPANDRGGLPDDRLVSGFDPTHKGFYNGGDLKGMLDRIDYIQGLGTTSIWLTPSFKNKPVQLEDGPSAGYHGYWITDFTQIDPHLGTNADLRALVDAAHARGMKVYFDIITNHTADVIGYQQGARRPYVTKDVVPYRTAAGAPFFMFGEVFDTTKSFTSQFTTRDQMQAVLDFPFQQAARDFAARSRPTSQLAEFFAGDDWYTDADSNVYQLPTFLGNHDMGRFGGFVQADNPGAGDQAWVARDRLAHELMYLSRGNPVVYYGDEQGFTGGTRGDQDARQSMFASQVPDYLDDDLLGTNATHAQANFAPTHPLYRSISSLAELTGEHPALRNGAHQHRFASSEPGIYAFSRTDRQDQREYVVALNNSEQVKTAAIPIYAGNRTFHRVYGDGPDRLRSAEQATTTLTVPPLSTVVYQMDGRVPRSGSAPAISLDNPMPAAESRGRMQVTANVAGSSFYEVSFYAKVGTGQWTPIGTDDTAPYRVFHDVSGEASGIPVQYRAVVLDNGGHTAVSQARDATVPTPLVTIEAPREGSGVRGAVELRAVVDPERASHVVGFERSVAGSPWTAVGSDDSSPVYTVLDNLAPLDLAAGTPVQYQATLTLPDGSAVTSAVRTVHAAGPPATMATLRYFRLAGDYIGWGLHMWGEAVDPAVLDQIRWDLPWPLTRVEADGWAAYEIPLVDDTKPVNFIMHLPSGDTVPISREPGGDRSFLPIDTPNVWIKQGDPTLYASQPPT